MPESLLTGERLDIPPFMRANNQQGKLNKPMPYPSPFFDLSKFYFPRSVKELFKWCRHYYKSNGLIATTIYKLSEYPVTDLIFETPENIQEEGTEKLKKSLKEDLDIKGFLIKLGIDFFTYGNALVSLYFPFKRMFVCPECEATHQFEDFNGFGKKGQLDFRNFEFKGNCPNCNAKGVTFEIEDIPIKQVKKINIIRHNPEHFDIEYNPVTGNSKYFYNIPKKVKRKIVNKDVDTLLTMPKVYFEAVKKKKAVKMKNSNIYHFKRSDVADDDMEWGMPLILPVMRDLFHLQVLRKAQQEIAMEHLVPLRVLFPSDNQSNAAPHRRGGLGNWKKNVEKEIRKWKRDPNYMPIMPVPLGNTTVSGDGKMLLLTQEMRQVSENVINGMGVPQEFVFGGLSWSGSSISLRMLENHFLVYRQSLLDFLDNFLIKKIANFMGSKKINIKMQEFKMADDVQRKQLLQQLNQMDKISDKTFLKEVAGLDSAAEVEQMIKDYKKRKPLFKLKGLKQGTVQGKVQEMVAKAGVIAKQKAAEAQEKGENQQPPIDMGGFWEELVGMIEQEQEMQQAQEEAPEDMATVQQDPEAMASRYAKQLMNFEPEKQGQILERMQKEMPQLAGLIQQKFQELQQAGAQAEQVQGNPPQEAEQKVDMRPTPDKQPPRRDNSPV